MLEDWLSRTWWLWFVLALIFWRQILDAFTAPRETLDIIRGWWRRAEPISLQYNAVEALIARPNKHRFIGVTVRVILDNPHPYPLRIRFEEMVTTFNWLQTSDLSDRNREDVIGAGARNLAVSLDQAAFQLRPNQESFPIRLIWRIYFGRDDLQPFKFEEKPLNVIGTLTVQRYANGLYESRWKEDLYGDPPVRDNEGGVIIEAPDGELQKR